MVDNSDFYDRCDKDANYSFVCSEIDKYRSSQALCRNLSNVQLPDKDMISADEREALKGCSSSALYYGIGMTADPVKARKCAIAERGQETDPWAYYESDNMLMTIYANGVGADRNFDAAISLACSSYDAPAAAVSRIDHLAKLKDENWQGSDFDICDDSTSSIAMGLCASHRADIAGQRRLIRIETLKRSWTPDQALLLDHVLHSFGVYLEESNGMNCHGGMAHAACYINGVEADTERFLQRIEALIAGREPPIGEPSNFGTYPAVTSQKQWREFVKHMDDDEREWHEAYRKRAIKARRRFNEDLRKFGESVFPTLSNRKFSKIFADL